MFRYTIEVRFVPEFKDAPARLLKCDKVKAYRFNECKYFYVELSNGTCYIWPIKNISQIEINPAPASGEL